MSGEQVGQRPSVIVARYRAGELSRGEAADALAVAAWPVVYQRASMAPGGDYDGSVFEPESFAMVVYQATWVGELDDEDYAAFSDAFARWKAARSGR